MDDERQGCDPTADSPDPVVTRLERELEMERGRSMTLEHDVARYEAKWRDAEAQLTGKAGELERLKEACWIFRTYGLPPNDVSGRAEWDRALLLLVGGEA